MKTIVVLEVHLDIILIGRSLFESDPNFGLGPCHVFTLFSDPNQPMTLDDVALYDDEHPDSYHYGGCGEMDSSKLSGGATNFRPGPRLTCREMDEKQSNGLCFLCEEKCTPNHCCPKKKLYAIQMWEMEDEEEEGEIQWEEGEGIL